MDVSSPNRPASTDGYQTDALAWLLGSVLFFFVVVVLGPQLWTGLEKPGSAPTHSTANKILAWMGLIAFFTEPLIWHYILLLNARKTTRQLTLPKQGINTGERSGWDKLYAFSVGLFWALPAAVFFIFKPILRALLLFLSLAFLGDVQAPGNHWNGFFNVAVAVDIFLYYLCRLAPQWKYNPVNILLRLLVVRSSRATRLAADLLLILHTAVTSSLLLSIMYASFRLEGQAPALGTLAGWWLALTLYNRLSLQPGLEDDTMDIRRLQLKVLALEALQLGVSLLAFLWPFYFSGQ